MDTTEVRTPRTAPISCPFASVVVGTAKKWRNNSYVPSIKCTSMWSPTSFLESDVIRSGYKFGDRSAGAFPVRSEAVNPQMQKDEPTRIRSKGCQDLFLFQMNLVNWLMWTARCLRHLVHGG